MIRATIYAKYGSIDYSVFVMKESKIRALTLEMNNIKIDSTKDNEFVNINLGKSKILKEATPFSSQTEYVCSVCTLINPIDSIRCTACDTLNPTYNELDSCDKIKEIESTRAGWWCSRCTYINPLTNLT